MSGRRKLEEHKVIIHMAGKQTAYIYVSGDTC